NKEQDRYPRQQLAAKNAAEFVVHALQFAPLQASAMGLREEVANQLATAQPEHSSLPTEQFFHGRENELSIIKEAISPEARTWGALIDGPGGVGKTSLAVHAGHLAP